MSKGWCKSIQFTFDLIHILTFRTTNVCSWAFYSCHIRWGIIITIVHLIKWSFKIEYHFLTNSQLTSHLKVSRATLACLYKNHRSIFHVVTDICWLLPLYTARPQAIGVRFSGNKKCKCLGNPGFYWGNFDVKMHMNLAHVDVAWVMEIHHSSVMEIHHSE